MNADSPLKSFIFETARSWFVSGDDSLIGFEDKLQAAMQRSKQYYDKMNKARVEAAERAREQQKVEREAKEALRIDSLVKSMSILESEISGVDLITVARFLNVELHPRTIGSIRNRINKIIIVDNGFGKVIIHGHNTPWGMGTSAFSNKINVWEQHAHDRWLLELAESNASDSDYLSEIEKHIRRFQDKGGTMC